MGRLFTVGYINSMMDINLVVVAYGLCFSCASVFVYIQGGPN